MKKSTFTWPSDMTIPLLLSIVLHLGIVVVLFAGFKFAPSIPEAMEVQLDAPINEELEPNEEEPVEKIVEAAAVDKSKITERAEEIRAERKRQEDELKALEQRAAEAKKRREAEQQRQRELEKQQKLERERLAKEKERALREQKEAEKKAAAAEERRRKEEEAAKKAEAERKRLEEQRKREEEERKRKEAEAKAKAERERQLQEELERERQQRAAARKRQVQSEVGKYTSLIRQTIQRQLITDPSMRGKECRVNIRLASSGFVISVNVLNGDPSVCQAAQNAVLKAGTLPVSDDPEVFAELKDINLTVKPEF